MGELWDEKSLNEFNVYMREATPESGTRGQHLDEIGGVQTLADLLATDTTSGVSVRDLDARKAKYGVNVMPERPRVGFFQLMLNAANDVTMIILMVAAVVSLLLGIFFPEEEDVEELNPVTGEIEIHVEKDSAGWVEGLAIMVAVVLVVVVTAVQDWDKDRKFRATQSMDVKRTRVVRDGKSLEVEATELVVGDLVLLKVGEEVPCDGVLVEAFDIQVDEASMTGESLPLGKNPDRDPWFISNTKMGRGTGRMVATAVGERSTWGEMLVAMQVEDAEDTPLQERLDAMAIAIGKVGLAVGVLVFFVLGIYWAVDTSEDIQETAWRGSYMRGLIDAIIIGITVLVVAIPEGLPLAVTISLAYSMRAMLQDNNLVRHLKACETMGGATNICSDKTGTLTLNQMTVKAGSLGLTPFDAVPYPAVSQEMQDLLTEGIGLNSDSYHADDPKRGRITVGNPTEMSLIEMMERQLNEEDFYDGLRKAEEPNKVLTVPFNSATKRMISVYLKKERGALVSHVKGAPDVLLPLCSSYMQPDGTVHELTEEARQTLIDRQAAMAELSYRTLLVAYREVDADRYVVNADAPVAHRYGNLLGEESRDPVDHGLTVLLMTGILDPVRPEVPGAVAQCQKAGVTVRMVTGDHKNTARAIAMECGIYVEDRGDVILEGREFRGMSDAQVDEILPNLTVLARSAPLDKERLVTRLMVNREVVGVTGDGTNDAPALKKADVGLAMGIMGTSVAKEAADIIIQDDNFASIVMSIKWGRTVFENIRKFLQFQLTVNVGALIVAFIGAVSDRGTPLRAVHLLWVNLIMDTMAALALGTEAPEDRLLDEKPYGRSAPLINNKMWKHIMGQALYQVSVLMVFLYAGHKIFSVGDEGDKEHYTLIFNAFVWMQVFNEFNCRKINDDQNVFQNWYRNPFFVGVIIITVGLQVMIIFVGGEAFKVEPLNGGAWGGSLIVGVGTLLIGAILRAIPVQEERSYPSILFPCWFSDAGAQGHKLRDDLVELDELHFTEVDL